MSVIYGMSWLDLFMFSYNQQDLRGSVEYNHAHEGLEFLYIHEGSGRLILNDRLYRIESPTLIFFQPFQPHSVHMSYPYSRSILKLKLPIDERFAQLYPSLHAFATQMAARKQENQVCPLTPAQHAELQQQFRLFHETMEHVAPPERKEYFYSFFAQFLSYCKTRIYSDQGRLGFVLDARALNHVEKVIQWIDKHYRHRFQLDQLAAEVHLSPSYLSRLFHRYTGSTILEYIGKRRMEEASTLLRTTSMTVHQVADAAGYSDAAYFCRCFKKKYAMTPIQYREFHR